MFLKDDLITIYNIGDSETSLVANVVPIDRAEALRPPALLR
jgi:hypothetical protein